MFVVLRTQGFSLGRSWHGIAVTDVGMRRNVAFTPAFRRIRSAVTPLRGYTTSAPAGHLLLKEKALACGKQSNKLKFA